MGTDALGEAVGTSWRAGTPGGVIDTSGGAKIPWERASIWGGCNWGGIWWGKCINSEQSVAWCLMAFPGTVGLGGPTLNPCVPPARAWRCSSRQAREWGHGHPLGGLSPSWPSSAWPQLPAAPGPPMAALPTADWGPGGHPLLWAGPILDTTGLALPPILLGGQGPAVLFEGAFSTSIFVPLFCGAGVPAPPPQKILSIKLQDSGLGVYSQQGFVGGLYRLSCVGGGVLGFPPLKLCH